MVAIEAVKPFESRLHSKPLPVNKNSADKLTAFGPISSAAHKSAGLFFLLNKFLFHPEKFLRLSRAGKGLQSPHLATP